MDYELIGFEDFPSKRTLLKAKLFNKMDEAIKYLCDKEKKSSEDVTQLKGSAQKTEKRLDALETFVPGSAKFEVGTEKKIGNIKIGNVNFVHYRKYFKMDNNTVSALKDFNIPLIDTSAEEHEEEPVSVLFLLDIRGIVGFGNTLVDKVPVGTYNPDGTSVRAKYSHDTKTVSITVISNQQTENLTLVGYIDYLRA